MRGQKTRPSSPGSVVKRREGEFRVEFQPPQTATSFVEPWGEEERTADTQEEERAGGSGCCATVMSGVTASRKMKRGRRWLCKSGKNDRIFCEYEARVKVCGPAGASGCI